MESYGGPQRDFEKKLATVSDAEERRDSVPLQEYFQMARKYESMITGEASDAILDSRFVITDQKENDIRIISLAEQIPDGSSIYSRATLSPGWVRASSLLRS